MKYVFIQGNLIAEDEAVLPVANRALRFGDGVFETMRVENGKIYNPYFHISRLGKGLKGIKLNANIDLIEISKNIISKNNLQNGFVRVAICRAGSSEGYLPTSDTATVFAETIDGFTNQPEIAKLHYSSYTAQSFVPAKTMNGLVYSLALMQAKEHGADNALLLDSNGHICETASGNIFWVKDFKVYTPAEHLALIPGSIRERVIKLHGAAEVVAGLDEIKNADEVFMTNVNCLVLPFTQNRHKTNIIKAMIQDDIRNMG